MADIKKRAERNGKIRRTISHIEQTIAKLERMKIEYMQKAVDAKARGESASYSLAKSGLNATLTQIKRAKEMQLNIEITAELQKMGETNADFLTAMSTIAKRISKINKQSDFVKLQKEIQTALSGMEEAQAGFCKTPMRRSLPYRPQRARLRIRRSTGLSTAKYPRKNCSWTSR